jgi:acetyl esterase/lipase
LLQEVQPPKLAFVTREPVYQFEVIQNVIYGRGLRRTSWNDPGGVPMNLTLDIYRPNTPPNRLRPAIMLFHGGGFKGGDAGYPRMVQIGEHFASRGWVVFSINYRLEGDFGSIPINWPEELNYSIYPAARDAKAAVRWLHANAETYQVSRDHITALGGSAGGMLSTMLGLTDPVDYRNEISLGDDPTLETTNLNAPATIQTVVSLWGGDPLLRVLQVYDGQSRYDSSDAPTLLIHGTEDEVVPLHYSERVYQGLQSVGVPVEFHILNGRKHGAWGASLADGRTILEAAYDFIVQQQNLPNE